ncbi:MAG: hypothetical protein IJJ23_01455 [Clostridia bacterium]|nr:hypothetical protein [Clostridia bacterium]
MNTDPVFYCQLDYDNVPYPSPANGFGTIANNGCGVCAVSMVAENMLGVRFPPEEAVGFALESGARVDVGTNLYILSEAFAKKFSIRLFVTEDGEQALKFLNERRGMVIANVRGNRPEDGHIGVFSDGGHYIVLTGVDGRRVHVLDPMYRPGRFDVPGRIGKVHMDGCVATADMSVVEKDCYERPYFLFEKPER